MDRAGHTGRPEIQVILRDLYMNSPFFNILKNIGLIAAGVLVYIVGMNGILVPKEFLNGGLTGISLMLTYLVPSLNLGLAYAALNIPMFVMGWFTISRSFVYYTGFGIVFFSVAAGLITVPEFPVNEPILAAILAGIICGIGAGLILRSAGSAGGLDILAVYLYKRFSLKMGMTSFITNSAILTAAAFIFNLETALYTLIFIFTQSKLTDAVITGFNRRKAVMIVSDNGEAIARAIMDQFHHGVTFLEGHGAHSGREKRVVMSITTLTELARLKDLAFEIDPNAFMVVNDTLDVLGVNVGRRLQY